MKRFKTHLALAALFAGVAIAGTMMKPHSTSAKNSNPSLVELVPSVPFGETESGGFGQPNIITVPAGQTLVIETVSLQMDVSGQPARSLRQLHERRQKRHAVCPVDVRIHPDVQWLRYVYRDAGGPPVRGCGHVSELDRF
jgi:hypothetical protein